MKVQLKAITPNAEVNIVEIARVSSTRTDKTEQPEGLIKYLIKNSHWSPFEHAFMTVEITTSKAIAIQLLRHRSFTFQEFSQRYAEVSNVEATEFRMQAEKNRQSSTVAVGNVLQFFSDTGNYSFKAQDTLENLETTKHHKEQVASWLQETAELYDAILTHYKAGLDLGIAKECARMVLPMATETVLYMSGTLRSWIHFLSIRDDAHAQLEVQIIAKQIKKIFIEQCPILSTALAYDKVSNLPS